MKFLTRQKNKNNHGFTLVETLVAISIFSISLIALMVVFGRSLSDTGYSKKKDVAAYLTQEGIEYIRNLRDTYVLYDVGGAQAGWNAFIAKLSTDSCMSADGCYFNADSLNYTDPSQPMIDIDLTPCSSSTCANGALSYNPATGKYGFSGPGSGFIRKIRVTPASPVNEARVLSTVSWTQGSGSYSITLTESLFNWVE